MDVQHFRTGGDGSQQGSPSPQGTVEFCVPGNLHHKCDYQDELNGKENVNKNFTHYMLLSDGFINLRDNLSHLLFLA